jgi:hypothetical protein
MGQTSPSGSLNSILRETRVTFCSIKLLLTCLGNWVSLGRNAFA